MCDYPVKKIHDRAQPFLATHPFTGREGSYGDPPYPTAARPSPRRYRADDTEQVPSERRERLPQPPCPARSSSPATPRPGITRPWGHGGRRNRAT